MKAKKPLLWAVLILALLAVALILPSAASGANDKQPVAWVSYGSVSPPWGPVLHEQSLLVQLCGDGSIRGHATIQVIKNPELPRAILMAGQGDFVAAGLIDDDTFWFTASFDAVVPPDSPLPFPLPIMLTCTYHDGPDAPGGTDPDWFTIAPLGLGGEPPLGNIVVHVRE